ncbi:MAG: hypothetical protein ACM3ZF_09790 [Mycobacterium leprae]
MAGAVARDARPVIVDDLSTAVVYQRVLTRAGLRSLLPTRLPEVGGAAVAARYFPGTTGMRVGGDWYDVLDLGHGGVLLVIGDVMGRGVRAAAVMGAAARGAAGVFAAGPVAAGGRRGPPRV